MQKAKELKGFALAAIVALLSSLFGALPSQAAAVDGDKIGVYPVAGTTFDGIVLEDFPMYLQLKEGVTSDNWTNAKVVYKVEVTSGTDMDVAVSASYAAVSLSSTTAANNLGTASVIAAGATIPSTTVSAAIPASGVGHLNIKASSTSAQTSWSAVTVRVTAWIDNQGGALNDVRDADEWFTTKTVTLKAISGVGAVVTLTQPTQEDTLVTASAQISGLNTANLDGVFFLVWSSSDTIFASSASTLVGEARGATHLATSSDVVSQSVTVRALSSSDSVSAALRFFVDGYKPATVSAGVELGSVATLGASTKAVDTLVLSALPSNDVSTSGLALDVRPNKTYTVRVHAKSISASVSGIVSVVTVTGPTLTTGSKTVRINGGAETTTYPAALSLTSAADGYASFTIQSVGFALGDVITVSAVAGRTAASDLTLTAVAPSYVIVNDFDNYNTTPGTAVALGYTVVDQWGVASTRTDQRLRLTKGGTGFAYAATTSTVAVSAGAATFTFTPEPAAKTGSATVTAVLEKWDTDVNAWVSGGSADGAITVNVSSTANAFSASVQTSYSASISYFPSTVSWTTIAGTATNPGATVVVSGVDTLYFRSADGKPTLSAGITVRSGADGAFTFDVASKLSGDQTITMVIGSATTTSLLVVDPPASDAGKSITIVNTNLASGATTQVVGHVLDMNGNGVPTTGSATIAVTYVGAGIVVGDLPTETDADGKFTFNLLAGSADSGTGTVTVTYYKSGVAATAVAERVTLAHSIAIGAAASTDPVADTKVNAGSFKGYVAVYAKGYQGKRLSAKIGNDWVVVESLASNFERVTDFTGAGYTIAVRIYIDRVLVDTITVTTK